MEKLKEQIEKEVQRCMDKKINLMAKRKTPKISRVIDLLNGKINGLHWVLNEIFESSQNKTIGKPKPKTPKFKTEEIKNQLNPNK